MAHNCPSQTAKECSMIKILWLKEFIWQQSSEINHKLSWKINTSVQKSTWTYVLIHPNSAHHEIMGIYQQTGVHKSQVKYKRDLKLL